MKGKVIYVDFIKKRRVTFIHFIINKLVSLLLVKFNLRTKSSNYMYLSKNRHISN